MVSEARKNKLRRQQKEKKMSKVTRIIYSDGLNQGKYEQLKEIAKRLGTVRQEVWHRYGAVQGVGLKHRQIRDDWLAQGRKFNVPARLWKETLRDSMANIEAYREACKVEVRRKVWKRGKDETERKRLFTILKKDQWLADAFLHRQMRLSCKHGQSKVKKQIVLDSDCYSTFELGGRAWLKVISLKRGQRVAIPLNTNVQPTGTLRLLLREGRVEVHYTIEEVITKDCGNQTLGLDKGYSEVYVDSEGERYGEGLGADLSQESDYQKTKYQRRHKLKAIARKKSPKRKNIEKNNLSRKKLNRRKRKHRQRIRDKIYKATHQVVDKAQTIVTEDLSVPIKGRSYGKDQNRRLSGWVTGLMAEALQTVSRRRGSTLFIVNAAYTSQVDARHGLLLGERQGEKFYCFDGVVLDADENAARNILARHSDGEIHRYLPYTQVKTILLRRTERVKERLGLLNQGSSYVQLSCI